MTDIEREWQYRYNEAIALGRTEKQARIEADEWRNKIEHEQKNTKGRFKAVGKTSEVS